MRADLLGVDEPETLFFINMTEERLQSYMCQVRGMMVTVLGMVTVCGLEESSRCVLEGLVLGRPSMQRSRRSLD